MPDNSETLAAALAYVRYVLKVTELSPTALAKEARISSTTLTRALNSPAHKFSLSLTTLNKIAAATGINYAPFLEAKDTAALNLATLHDERTFNPLDWKEREASDLQRTLVIGEVAIGEWKEVEAFDFGDYAPVHVGLTKFSLKNSFAVYVKGNSTNNLAQDDELLLCARLSDPSQLDDSIGVAIIERRNEDRTLIELSCRIVYKDHADDDLWSMQGYSKEDRFRHIIKSRLDGSDGARMLGEVLYVVREIVPLRTLWREKIVKGSVD